MKITVCELPNPSEALDEAWLALCQHTSAQRPELVLLPEFAFVEPFWEREHFDSNVWIDALSQCDAWFTRLPELNTSYVVGTRPVSTGGNRYNEGFLWSKQIGYRALRRKYFLPEETGGREATWFARGDREFPAFSAGDLSFGLNVCTELWALDTYGKYAKAGVNVILAPRATEAATISKWLSVGTVAAVRSGAYSLSSNRTSSDGSYGGVGWIIAPNSELLARTSAQSPLCTLDIDLAASKKATATYPRYVFSG